MNTSFALLLLLLLSVSGDSWLDSTTDLLPFDRAIDGDDDFDDDDDDDELLPIVDLTTGSTVGELSPDKEYTNTYNNIKQTI